ncbi:MAG: hypothetical protein ACRYG4_08745, partial [Janthinobacterium lividum]
GTMGKPPSEPSVGNLRSLLEYVKVSIPEFFLDEAQGRLIRKPSRRSLEETIEIALKSQPRSADKRASYLAAVIEETLELPELASVVQASPHPTEPGIGAPMPQAATATNVHKLAV